MLTDEDIRNAICDTLRELADHYGSAKAAPIITDLRNKMNDYEAGASGVLALRVIAQRRTITTQLPYHNIMRHTIIRDV